MPKLQRSSLAIESSLDHIKSSKSQGSDIEAYLAQYILIVLCAEIQQSIYEICRKRAESLDDAGVKLFANAAVTKLLRSVDKTDLAGFVANFGNDCKERFNRALLESEFQVYSNAIKNRNKVAHTSGANVSLSELERIIPIAESVLDAVESSIRS